MEIYSADGITLGVKEFTRTVTTPDGKKERVTYHEGDPEFDAYVETQRKQLEPALPIDFVSFGQGKSGAHGWQLEGQIRDKFDQYYAGEADMKDLERTISDVVSDLRSNYADQGFDPDEFMEDLLLDVYDVARTSVITGAHNQGWLDSRPLAAQYNGHDGNTKDTTYYDAKYYYQSEDMKAALPEMFQRIGQRFGVRTWRCPRNIRMARSWRKCIHPTTHMSTGMRATASSAAEICWMKAWFRRRTSSFSIRPAIRITASPGVRWCLKTARVLCPTTESFTYGTGTGR